SSRARCRIGPQIADLYGTVAQLLEHLLHGFVLDVTLEINEEHIGPDVVAGRPRLDLGEADLVAIKRFQHPEQCTGFVLGIDKNRRLVPATGPGTGFAEYEEAGAVVVLIL